MKPPQEIEVFIGVGSNLEGPLERCQEAVRRLAEAEGVTVARYSPWYRTDPVGPPDQPDYVNGVVQIETALDPLETLRLLRTIEDQMGRRRGPHWSPRVIDLDLLLYGDVVLKTEVLTLPHPELHHRRFVLVPLLDLSPQGRHPLLERGFRDLLEALPEGQGVVPLALEKEREGLRGHGSGEIHRH